MELGSRNKNQGNNVKKTRRHSRGEGWELGRTVISRSTENLVTDQEVLEGKNQKKVKMILLNLTEPTEVARKLALSGVEDKNWEKILQKVLETDTMILILGEHLQGTPVVAEGFTKPIHELSGFENAYGVKRAAYQRENENQVKVTVWAKDRHTEKTRILTLLQQQAEDNINNMYKKDDKHHMPIMWARRRKD